LEEENSLFLFVFIHYSRNQSQLIGKKVNEEGDRELKERESARPIYAAWDRVSASELEFDGE